MGFRGLQNLSVLHNPGNLKIQVSFLFLSIEPFREI